MHAESDYNLSLGASYKRFYLNFGFNHFLMCEYALKYVWLNKIIYFN